MDTCQDTNPDTNVLLTGRSVWIPRACVILMLSNFLGAIVFGSVSVLYVLFLLYLEEEMKSKYVSTENRQLPFDVTPSLPNLRQNCLAISDSAPMPCPLE